MKVTTPALPARFCSHAECRLAVAMTVQSAPMSHPVAELLDSAVRCRWNFPDPRAENWRGRLKKKA